MRWIEKPGAHQDDDQAEPEGPAGFLAVARQAVPEDQGGQMVRPPPLLHHLPAPALDIDLIGPVLIAAVLEDIPPTGCNSGYHSGCH